jgi:predicted flap endonuclease-1-like 5' DNA nuclease
MLSKHLQKVLGPDAMPKQPDHLSGTDRWLMYTSQEGSDESLILIGSAEHNAPYPLTAMTIDPSTDPIVPDDPVAALPSSAREDAAQGNSGLNSFSNEAMAKPNRPLLADAPVVEPGFQAAGPTEGPSELAHVAVPGKPNASHSGPWYEVINPWWLLALIPMLLAIAAYRRRFGQSRQRPEFDETQETRGKFRKSTRFRSDYSSDDLDLAPAERNLAAVPPANRTRDIVDRTLEEIWEDEAFGDPPKIRRDGAQRDYKFNMVDEATTVGQVSSGKGMTGLELHERGLSEYMDLEIDDEIFDDSDRSIERLAGDAYPIEAVSIPVTTEDTIGDDSLDSITVNNAEPEANTPTSPQESADTVPSGTPEDINFEDLDIRVPKKKDAPSQMARSEGSDAKFVANLDAEREDDVLLGESKEDKFNRQPGPTGSEFRLTENSVLLKAIDSASEMDFNFESLDDSTQTLPTTIEAAQIKPVPPTADRRGSASKIGGQFVNNQSVEISATESPIVGLSHENVSDRSKRESALLAELNILQQENRQLLKSSQQERRELTSSLESAQSELESFTRQQHQQLDELRREQQQLLESQRQQLDELRLEQQRLFEAQQQREADALELQQQYGQQNSKLKRQLTQQQAKLQQQIELQRQPDAEALASQKQWEQQNSVLKQQLDESQAELRQLLEFQQQRDAEARELQQQVEQKNSQLKTQLDQQQAELQQLLEFQQQRDAEARELQQQAEQQNSQLKTQLDQQQAELQQQLEIQQQRDAEALELQQLWEQQNSELKQQLDSQESELQQQLVLRQEVKALDTEHQKLLQQLSDLRESQADELKAKVNELDRLTRQLQDLHLSLAELEQENKSLREELESAQASATGNAIDPDRPIRKLSLSSHKEDDSTKSAQVSRKTKKKFTKLFHSYERERKLRKESELLLVEAEEQRNQVTAALRQLKNELAKSKAAVEPSAPTLSESELQDLQQNAERLLQQETENRLPNQQLAGHSEFSTETASSKTPANKASFVIDQPKTAKDNLTLIAGIGKATQQMLNRRGVMTFEQIANWSDAEVAKFSEELGVSSGTLRNVWIKHARKQ